jgi:nucleoside-diphosphate-sugar epimerase
MTNHDIGVFGATSFVGNHLLRLLTNQNLNVIAYSRRDVINLPALNGVTWKPIEDNTKTHLSTPSSFDSIPLIQKIQYIPFWISVAPIWTLPDHFDFLRSHGIKRIVALSSTSRFAKVDSSNPFEKDVARRLTEGEVELQIWANSNNIQWIILRPTLIYGNGLDRNISSIASFIRKFGFFPLFGDAAGLRQPVHAEDVASSCITTLLQPEISNQAYNISGGETLPYRDMVKRIFTSLGLTPRLVNIPLWLFQFSISFLHIFPRFRHLTTAMAERMNQDLYFDHSDAKHDFGYSPRPFDPMG